MPDLNGFDASNEKERGDFDPIPAGDYLAAITASEMKATAAKTGHYLALTFEICEGQHSKRLIWCNLNLDNPNPKAVEIARQELAEICRAVGILRPRNTEQLHGIPVVVKVICKKGDDDKIRNEIKRYSPRGGMTAALAAPPPTRPATAPPPPARPTTAPWARQPAPPPPPAQDDVPPF